jgi:hypothetical protein
VVGRGGARGAAGEQVGQERLQVGAGGGLDRGAVGAQEGIRLAKGDEVGGHGALGAVLGAQVPLERADEGASGRLLHDSQG